MIECYSCGYEMDEEDNEFECLYCGENDMGEGFYRCENCGALNTWVGDESMDKFIDTVGEVHPHIFY